MSQRFDPGQIRHLLVLQEATYAADTDGGFGTQWMDIASLWASIKPVGADVQLRAAAGEVDVTHTLVVRHSISIKPNMRFRKGARAFIVVSVNDLDETGRYTTVTTREEAA